MVSMTDPELRMRIQEVCEAADRYFHEHILDWSHKGMQDYEIDAEKRFLYSDSNTDRLLLRPKGTVPTPLNMDFQ